MESNQLPATDSLGTMPSRIEQAISALGTDVARGFARVDERLVGVDGRLVGVEGRLAGVDERLVGVDGRLAGVDERLIGVDQRLVRMDGQFAEVRQEIRDGDEQTRAQMRVLIESVRDDVRIFAEAHVALDQRVTALERRPR